MLRGLRLPAARRWCAAGVFVWGGACVGDAIPASTRAPQIRFHEDSGSLAIGTVDAYPLMPDAIATLHSADARSDAWRRVLSVHVGDSTGLPMLGSYSIVGDTVRFAPRFSPAPGATYLARFQPSVAVSPQGRRGAISAVSATWTRPGIGGSASTTVEGIYPTADQLPMNLLRMYVHFSAPMTTGRSYDFITLYTGADSLLEEPFFTAGGAVELWDSDKTRLTILFDPGRIKRDLRPHEELGLPLRQGVRYRLVIDSMWPDAQGRPLLRGYEKRFRVGAPDRSLVRTSGWIVTAPRRGTRDSLVLVFPEPLDQALLQRMLVVRDSTGASVSGDLTTSQRETRWAFAPRHPWRGTAHYVEVDTELEDLAGNSVRKLFDVAPGDARGVDSARVRVPFVPH